MRIQRLDAPPAGALSWSSWLPRRGCWEWRQRPECDCTHAHSALRREREKTIPDKQSSAGCRLHGHSLDRSNARPVGSERVSCVRGLPPERPADLLLPPPPTLPRRLSHLLPQGHCDAAQRGLSGAMMALVTAMASDHVFYLYYYRRTVIRQQKFLACSRDTPCSDRCDQRVSTRARICLLSRSGGAAACNKPRVPCADLRCCIRFGQQPLHTSCSCHSTLLPMRRSETQATSVTIA